MQPKNLYSFKLDEAQQERLVEILSTGNYRPAKVPYTRIAADAESWFGGKKLTCRVNLYTTGKCLIQGGGAEEFMINVMEPLVLRRVVVGVEDQLSEEALSPHMGIDESGKGDFFGPLVIAAAFTNETLAKKLQELGVKDSKAISSDKQALLLGAKIRGVLGANRYTVVRVGNATYNRLYAKMRSVNRLLSWGHARCIENLLTTVPSCPKAISDQFGNKESVEKALMQKGQNIELVQRHKAEADIAVAAASILAREAFLVSLQDLEKQYGQPFPKGASDLVRDAAKKLIAARGPDVMIQTAKCHFKTLDVVLGECGVSRETLPPEGRVVSQVAEGRDFRQKKTDA